MKSYARVMIHCVVGLVIAACLVPAAHGQWRGRRWQATQWRQAATPVAQSQATNPPKSKAKLPDPTSTTSQTPIQAQYRRSAPTTPQVTRPPQTAVAPVPAPVTTDLEAANTAVTAPAPPAPAPTVRRRPTTPVAPRPITVTAPRPASRPANRYGRSIITFDNQSGKAALVRLMGPTRAEVLVPNRSRNTINRVAAGHYVIRVRYGSEGAYRYTEGDHFDVHGSGMSYSRVTITLHGVMAGNYSMHGSSAADFAAAAP